MQIDIKCNCQGNYLKSSDKKYVYTIRSTDDNNRSALISEKKGKFSFAITSIVFPKSISIQKTMLVLQEIAKKIAEVDKKAITRIQNKYNLQIESIAFPVNLF